MTTYPNKNNLKIQLSKDGSKRSDKQQASTNWTGLWHSQRPHQTGCLWDCKSNKIGHLPSSNRQAPSPYPVSVMNKMVLLYYILMKVWNYQENIVRKHNDIYDDKW